MKTRDIQPRTLYAIQTGGRTEPGFILFGLTTYTVRKPYGHPTLKFMADLPAQVGSPGSGRLVAVLPAYGHRMLTTDLPEGMAIVTLEQALRTTVDGYNPGIPSNIRIEGVRPAEVRMTWADYVIAEREAQEARTARAAQGRVEQEKFANELAAVRALLADRGVHDPAVTNHGGGSVTLTFAEIRAILDHG